MNLAHAQPDQSYGSSIWLWLFLVLGCHSTETGNPPLTGIDLGRVVVTPTTAPPDGGPIPPRIIMGQPGALEPTIVSVQATPWDSTSPPVVAARAADGSFSLTIPHTPGGEVRFQTIEATRRLSPVDVVLEYADLHVLDHPLGGCLSVPSEGIIATPEAIAVIAIVNHCDEPVEAQMPVSRQGLLTNAGPFTVPTHAEFDLETRFLVPAALAEDLLLVGVTAPSMDRFAVTVRVAQP